jgi:hypothetical protein
LRQIAPSVFGALIHGLSETVPLGLGVGTASTAGGRSRNSRELIVLRFVLLAVAVLHFVIHGVDLREETIGVIGKLIGISQDVLHGAGSQSEGFHVFVLLDQRIFQSNGVLIQNRRSFNTEVINYGACFLA